MTAPTSSLAPIYIRGVHAPIQGIVHPSLPASLNDALGSDDRMVWFFDRGTDVLTLETRYDNEAAEYVAIVRDPTGQPKSFRFKDAVEFRTWLLEFENDLEDQQWRIRSGGPTILPNGWPTATPKDLV